MGFVVMILVILILFFMLQGTMGIMGAALFCGLLVVSWSMLNFRATSTGAFKASIRAYHTARAKGLGHNEALMAVLRSRYPISERKRAKTWYLCQKRPATSDEGQMLKNLVFAIYCNERGTPPSLELTNKILYEIGRVYDSIHAKY